MQRPGVESNHVHPLTCFKCHFVYIVIFYRVLNSLDLFVDLSDSAWNLPSIKLITEYLKVAVLLILRTRLECFLHSCRSVHVVAVKAL